MISKEGHNVIQRLISIIHETKGQFGTIKLTVSFDNTQGHQEGMRGVIAPRPVCLEQKALPSEDAVPTFETTGTLPVGTYIRFAGLVPHPGYLHLFNLGTSGTCTKLTPSKEHPHNAVSPDQVFEIPSPQFFGNRQNFVVQRPTTAESDQPERLLAILTTDDIDLQCTDLHPRLINRDAYTHHSRGPGFSGPVGAFSSTLSLLNKTHWEYGLVELKVV